MRHCLVLLLLIHTGSTYAQDPSLYFSRLTTANGLSHNKVNCIFQDKRGFIWIGTDDGLNRYDGSHFVSFRHQPGNTACLSGNIITGIFQDEDEIVWIGTADGGLTRYDFRLPAEQQFRQYKHLPGDARSIPGNGINALLQDRNGYLWLATSGNGVLRFDKHSGRFEQVSKGSRSTMLALCLDRNGVLWVGREGGSILKVNTRDLSATTDPRYEDLYAKLPHASVTSLFMDGQQNIWYGSWDRVLFRYNAMGQEEVFRNEAGPFSFVNDDILCMQQDKNGLLWMGGRYNGLQLFDPAQNKFYHYAHDAAREGTIADGRINCVYIDPSGIVWLGTNKGVSVHNPLRQQFRQTFLPHAGKDITIYDLYKNGQELWIGTSEGLFIKAPDKDEPVNRHLTYKGYKLAVTKFFRDQDSSYYIGTDYSLFRYDPLKGSIEPLPDNGKDLVMNKIIESRVVSVLRDTIDSRPALLTSPYGHYLAYYDLGAQRWVSRLDTSQKIIRRLNLRDNLIRKFYRAEDGTIWLANAKMGLGEWPRSNSNKTPAQTETLPVTYYSNNPHSGTSISNDNVFDIANDASGNLWVSTYGGGLNYMNRTDRQFLHIPASNNLLEGIQTDRQGNVWMISNGNIQKYDPLHKTYASFELPDIEKSGGVRGYVVKDGEGNLYVSGSNYYIAFRPDDISETYRQPRVYFTDLKVVNNSRSHLLFEKEIQLQPNQNHVSIDFSAPEFSSGKVHYWYMLEGWDNDWIDAEGRNTAQYSNLAGGSYTFKVKAATNMAGWVGNAAQLQFRIIPPVWKRWWFYGLCILLSAGIIYAAYRYRIKELLRLQDIRNKIAQDLHDNVGSTLSSVSIYSQVAKIQHENGNTGELKDILVKIRDTSTDMISEMNDIVWAINPRNDGMEKILQRMESFAKPLLQARNIGFSFHFDKPLASITLSMEQRKNLYLIFKEIVNNTLKYSSATSLEIKIALSHHKVSFTAHDNGVGFDVAQMEALAAKSLSGNGLLNMKRRAKEMNGACEIKCMPGQGTTIFLRFPIT